MKDYLECGFVTAIHGLKGAVIVKHLCDSYEVFANLKRVFVKSDIIDSSYTEIKIKKASPYKGMALVYLDKIDDADKAMKYRKKTLYAFRDDILKDDGSFFIADIIGLDVFDFDTGVKYGVLQDVINSGAQDIYVIRDDKEKLSYVPAISEFVKEISLEKGIFIKPIEGMIE